MTKLSCAIAALGLAAPMLAPRVEAGGCTPITSVPFTITVPGAYCLTAPLSLDGASGNAITVMADDVVVDLAGFQLTGTLGGPHTQARGIYALNRKRLTIRGGTITGFRYGVLIADSVATSEGHRVEHLTVRGSRAAGIALTGAGSHIVRCHVIDTIGSGPFAVGISQTGSGTTLMHNVVDRTRAADTRGFAAGIDLNHGFNRSVRSNRVRQVDGGGFNYGIRCGYPFVALNEITRARPRVSACVSTPGDPFAYPYPYPYPFAFGYPYPYPLDTWASRFGHTRPMDWDVVALALMAMLATKHLAAAALRA
jgi:hypothetical protein